VELVVAIRVQVLGGAEIAGSTLLTLAP
jgi:hypothetical protein